MLSNSGAFSSFSCPDNNCQRPYCQYSHDKNIAPKVSISTKSTSSVVISQEEQPILNDYVGYYSTPTSSTTNQAYDPFATTYNYSSSSYAPEAPTTSYITNSYTPQFDSYIPTTETYNGSGGFTANDDISEITNTKKNEKPEIKQRTRKDSSEYVDPSKPVLPPDLGNDEILQFGKKPTRQESFVSKKSKKSSTKSSYRISNSSKEAYR
jgi:hypothetical protein